MENPNFAAEPEQRFAVSDREYSFTSTYEEIVSTPTDTIFNYLYDVNWECFLKAAKALKLILWDIDAQSESVRRQLYTNYPKLKELERQTDMFCGFNRSGTSLYYRGKTAVGSASYKDNMHLRTMQSCYWSLRHSTTAH